MRTYARTPRSSPLSKPAGSVAFRSHTPESSSPLRGGERGWERPPSDRTIYSPGNRTYVRACFRGQGSLPARAYGATDPCGKAVAGCWRTRVPFLMELLEDRARRQLFSRWARRTPAGPLDFSRSSLRVEAYYRTRRMTSGPTPMKPGPTTYNEALVALWAVCSRRPAQCSRRGSKPFRDLLGGGVPVSLVREESVRGAGCPFTRTAARRRRHRPRARRSCSPRRTPRAGPGPAKRGRRVSLVGWALRLGQDALAKPGPRLAASR